jgi:hypothetical protein
MGMFSRSRRHLPAQRHRPASSPLQQDPPAGFNRVVRDAGNTKPARPQTLTHSFTASGQRHSHRAGQLLDHVDVITTMIFTQVLRMGGGLVCLRLTRCRALS